MSGHPENREAASLPENAAPSSSSNDSSTTDRAEGKRPFIPAWLDDAKLSQAEFRLYCNLARRADKNGIARPSVDGRDDKGKPLKTSIVSVCGMSRRTAWKAIKSLESKNLIEKLGRWKLGSANRYKILFPIGANQAPNDDPIDAIEAPNGNGAIDAIEAPSFDANQPLLLTQSRPREGSPMKVPQRRESNIPQNEPVELNLAIDETPNGTGADTIAAEIYQAYPRKVSRKDAVGAILKAMKRHPAAFLLERTKAYAAAIAWQEPQFIPYPATWFNAERFNDDPTEWEKPATNGGKPAPMSLEEAAKLLGGRAPHRQTKAASEYPEPKPKLPRL